MPPQARSAERRSRVVRRRRSSCATTRRQPACRAGPVVCGGTTAGGRRRLLTLGRLQFSPGRAPSISRKSMESVLVGVSGVKRNACAAVCVDGDVTAVCEQERVTRVRGIGLTEGTLPGAAVEEVLSIAGKTHSGVESYVLAERGVRPPLNGRSTVLDHHQAHAATAFLTSPFATAAVLICDSSGEREVSVWLGDGSGLHDQGWSWHDTAFASLYSAAAELFGLPPGQEHRL